MEYSVERTAEQIYQKGGEEAARLLSALFKSLNENLARDFEPDQVIDDLFARLGGYNSPYYGNTNGFGNPINVENLILTPNWNQYASESNCH